MISYGVTVMERGRKLAKSRGLGALRRFSMAALGLAACIATNAQAQTYVSGSDGAINSATTCSAPLVRNFSVTDSFTVADVDLGVFATHSWRGDMRISLQSPTGTRVQLVDGDTNNVSGDNFNVRLDDNASQLVNTDNATGAHSTTAPPPFANRFRPNAALSAFNGQNSNGIWRLEICDRYPSDDDGTFRHAELYLTALPSNFADLSLSKSVDQATPSSGAGVTYTLEVSNSGSSTDSASSIRVLDLLPMGVAYTSHSGAGTYDPGTGIWQVGTLAPGGSATLTISATVTASSGASITNSAEIVQSSMSDPDSTPGNGSVGEDDHATATLTVTGTRIAGTPPVLTCPAGNHLFDWDAISWAAGSIDNSYPLAAMGPVRFLLGNPGAWLSNATFGGQAPTLQTAMTGGMTGAGQSLIQLVNMPSRNDVATTTITLPRSVMAAQFRIFDVDFGNNQFADRIVVNGTFRGQNVTPILTNGIANYVIGNTAYGDAASGNSSADGNVVVTFQQPIDGIVIQYGNHALAPADPGQQGIAVHDITLCQPTTAISATKVSAVLSDPVNGTDDPKAIPGAMIDYTISVTNTGLVEVDDGSVDIIDDVPSDTMFCVADIAAGGGPVRFVDGAPASELTYSYAALGNGADDLSFSNDNGASFGYTPVADGDGCDGNVTNIRVAPSGALAPGAGFTLKARFKVR